MMPTALFDLLYIIMGLIPASAAIRIIVCLAKINTDPDQASQYKTRLKNVLIFIAVSECALLFLVTIYYYFS